jgi:hypothetical protein
MKKIIMIAVAFALVIVAFVLKSKNTSVVSTPQNKEVIMNQNTEVIEAIKKSASIKYAVVKKARVTKILPDDKNGPLHQRWIVEIGNDVTVTVFHNVDIAERIPLSVGDIIDLAGELEYGDRWKDPIIHWTHEDPQGHRQAGYVILNSTTYGGATGP